MSEEADLGACPRCGNALEELYTGDPIVNGLIVACGHCVDHLYLVMYEELNICGCGSPEDAFTLVRQVLDLAPFYEDQRWRQLEPLIGSPGAYHLVLSALTHANLLEHGGGIGGSWLTGKGAFVREALRHMPMELLGGQVGYPHYGQDCTDACWVLAETAAEPGTAESKRRPAPAPEPRCYTTAGGLPVPREARMPTPSQEADVRRGRGESAIDQDAAPADLGYSTARMRLAAYRDAQAADARRRDLRNWLRTFLAGGLAKQCRRKGQQRPLNLAVLPADPPPLPAAVQVAPAEGVATALPYDAADQLWGAAVDAVTSSDFRNEDGSLNEEAYLRYKEAAIATACSARRWPA